MPPVEGRIPRLPRDQAIAVAEQAGVPTFVCDLSIFQVLLRHPRLARAVNDFLGPLLARGALDPRLRELIIMRVAWQTGSVYEWTQHWRLGSQLGVSESDLVGVRDWERHEGFGPTERAVLTATDEALAQGVVSRAAWDACVEQISSTAALLEVPAVIGGWRMISMLLRTLEVPLEDGVEPWPPDSLAPPSPRTDAD